MRKKSRKLMDEVGEFQNEVGGAIIPFQRIGLYVLCVIFFATGLGLIIYAATHPDMDIVPNTRDTMYLTGGVILALSIIIFFLGRYWLQTVSNSRALRQFNATMFEIDMARDMFRR